MKIFAFFFAVCCALRCHGQNLDFYGLFPVLSNTQVVNRRFDVNFLAASKISGITRQIEGINYPPKNLEIYFQTQLSYKHTQHIAFGVAYGFQRNNPFEQNYTHEHRFVQHLLYSTPIRKKNVYHRFRFEERLIQPSNSERYTLGTRVRYLIGMMVPLRKGTYLNFSNEIFLITSGPRNSFFAEDMSYVGVGKKITGANTIEIGAVYNPTVRNAAGDIRNLFLFQLLWSSSVHWKEKQPPHPMMHFRHY